MTPSAPFRPERVRGIVFDLDGTLVDSYGPIAESLNRARAVFGLPPLDEAVVRTRVGRGLERLVADLVGPDRVDCGVAAFRSHYARVFADRTAALSGARDVLTELRRRGYRLAVASNKPARFSEVILERLGMRGALDAVHGPDTVGGAKPDPVMIRACLEAMEVTAAAAVYVGDMVLDVESADEAGVAVVLVAGGSSPEDALRATGRPVLGRLADLLPLLPGESP